LRKPYSLNDLAAVLAAFEPAGSGEQTDGKVRHRGKVVS